VSGELKKIAMIQEIYVRKFTFFLNK